jgi:hypothetical protein
MKLAFDVGNGYNKNGKTCYKACKGERGGFPAPFLFHITALPRRGSDPQYGDALKRRGSDPRCGDVLKCR